MNQNFHAKVRPLGRWLAVSLGLGAPAVQAELLGGLDPATALYDSQVKGIVDDGGTAGSKSGVPALGDPEHALGFTFSITFTPNAADLERTTPTAAKTVLLIELGGTSNGAGLYLVDGVPTLLSKQGSNDVTVPGSLNDLTLPAIAVQSPIGKLAAGTSYSFSGSWNHAGTVELRVKPDGGNLTLSTHAISGTPGNWSGNDTLSVKTISAVGSVGGLAGSNAANVLGPPFDVHDAANFSGAISRAVFWNVSSVTPPILTAPVISGFEVTKLATGDQVRLHWRVSEGGAPNPTTIQIKADDTVLSSPTALQGFADVDAGGATRFTLEAVNATGAAQRTAAPAADTAFSTVVRADSPAAWFRFNEAAGSQLIADSADNAAPHDGRSYGQPVSGGSGFLDGAASFDGGRGVISDKILDPGNLESGFTIEAIVRRAPGVVGANPVIAAQRGTTGRFFLTSSADGTVLTDLGGGQIKQADGKLHDNVWSHLAVVVDAQHTDIRWYLDGVLVGSSADGTNPDGTTFDPYVLEASDGEWIFGLGKALTGNYWKGDFDEIAIYPRVLDDPDGNLDFADSRIPAHRNAWWGRTTGLLDYSSSKSVVSAGEAVQLVVKAGADVTAVTIDQGVGSLSLVDGTASVTVNPAATTTYQATLATPAGPLTRSLTVTALQFQAPAIQGFEVTRLAEPGRVRLHWKVSQGEAPNPTTLEFRDGATVLHTTTALQGFADVDAGAATAFTLVATNATGAVQTIQSPDAESAFSAAVRVDSPVAWFRFNEAAGSPIFVDSAANETPHDAHPYGTPVAGVAGVIDGSVTFDGASAVVSDLILNPGELDPGFSIEAVVRRRAGTGNANHAIVSQADLEGTGRVIFSVTDSGKVRSLLGQAVAKDADQPLAAETWSHVVIVVDALNGVLRWYLDGEPIGTTADGVNPDGSTFTNPITFEASKGVWNIGAQKTLASDLWKGEIDEVVVYNTLLDDPDANNNTDDSRIAAHYGAWRSSTTGVISYGASSSTIEAGQSTDLSIAVGADITAVSIDPGVGAVTLQNGVATVSVSPTTTTTYTITLTGPNGVITRTVTITVNAAASPLRIVSAAAQGGSFVLAIQGAPSTTYAVRGSTDLVTFGIDHGTVTTDAAGLGAVTLPVDPAKKSEFYRLQDLP